MPEDKRKKSLGNFGEKITAERLYEYGYRLIETNWRCELGEVDIIAWHDKCLTFIEVRTRRGSSAGTPEESVTPAKQRRLVQLVEAYLQLHPDLQNAQGEFPPCRIDLAAVEFDTAGHLIRLQIRKNIIAGDY